MIATDRGRRSTGHC